MGFSAGMLKWWFGRWRRYNRVTILSGLICCILLYASALFFRRPFHIFFMTPLAAMYLGLLNLAYIMLGFLYFLLAEGFKWIDDRNERRFLLYKVIALSTVLFNGLLLVLFLFEFKIIETPDYLLELFNKIER